jgi:hypothetical protein
VAHASTSPRIPILRPRRSRMRYSRSGVGTEEVCESWMFERSPARRGETRRVKVKFVRSIWPTLDFDRTTHKGRYSP